jgi:predicted GIY-YIG superfamily endonuclease
MDPSFNALLRAIPVKGSALPMEIPKRGVYLFSEGDQHLYVGRSNRIRERLQSHCRPSSGHNSATFAFRIARETTGIREATYATKGSRTELEKDPLFGRAFSEAKARVRTMDIRYVEEVEPMRQAILEMYVALSLETPFNDFDNH